MSIPWKRNINQSVGKKVEKNMTMKNTGVFLYEWKPQPVTWAFKIYHIYILYIIYMLVANSCAMCTNRTRFLV